MALATSLPNYRIRYGKWIDPLPEDNTLAEVMDFVSMEMRQGGIYACPVQVSQEQGITLNTDGSVFTTNAAIDAVIKEAQVGGSEIAAVAEMSSNELSRSSNGASKTGQASPAFWKIADLKMKNTMTLFERTREVNLAFGAGTAAAIAADLGVVSASISGANLAAPQIVTITRATWMPGFWPSMQNALVDIYQTNGSTVRETSVTMQTITEETQNRLQLFKTASAAVVAANDRIVLVGAKDKSCYGIQAIGENVGTLFNIDALANVVWRVFQMAAFGAPTRAKIMQMSARLFNRGVTKGGTLFCCATMLSDLIEEVETSHRFIDNDGPKVKRQGSSALIYTTPAGDIKVVAHKYWKQGFFFFLANHPDEAGTVGQRVGSTDGTFEPSRGGMLFQPLHDRTGARIREYSHQAPFLTMPWHCIWGSGVTSNADTLPS